MKAEEAKILSFLKHESIHSTISSLTIDADGSPQNEASEDFLYSLAKMVPQLEYIAMPIDPNSAGGLEEMVRMHESLRQVRVTVSECITVHDLKNVAYLRAVIRELQEGGLDITLDVL